MNPVSRRKLESLSWTVWRQASSAAIVFCCLDQRRRHEALGHPVQWVRLKSLLELDESVQFG
jgi:hypothetical protein